MNYFEEGLEEVRMALKHVLTTAALYAFPALGLTGESMGLTDAGPYDTHFLESLQGKIENGKFSSNWCIFSPLASKVFLENSCSSALIWENWEENRLYYAMSGKPAADALSSGHKKPEITGDNFPSGFAGTINASGLGSDDAHSQGRAGGNSALRYDDRITFLLETNESGEVLDSAFYIFYGLDGFERRGIKPDYSNFENAVDYMKSVRKYSYGMEFKDIISLIEEGGMTIDEGEESQVTFITPIHPYRPRSNADSIMASIEFRAGIILTPNWPDYARVTLAGDRIVFEATRNGNIKAWEIIE